MALSPKPWFISLTSNTLINFLLKIIAFRNQSYVNSLYDINLMCQSKFLIFLPFVEVIYE